MAKKVKEKSRVLPVYTFAGVWAVLSVFLPMYKLWALLLTALLSLLSALTVNFIENKQLKKSHTEAADLKENDSKAENSSSAGYGPEIDPIVNEGRTALREMGRLYASINEPDIRRKINELMRITDKITQDAILDPSDIPQIKKFMNYYLPTTIKLLNTYDRMSAQGIEGENLGKSMQSINEMLDEAIAAFKRRLDSLFANQAMDIESEIKVMNTMLAREGLAGERDFNVQEQKGQEI